MSPLPLNAETFVDDEGTVVEIQSANEGDRSGEA